MYVSDVEILMNKILSEDMEQTHKALKQPLPENMLCERESFSDPLFALKMQQMGTQRKKRCGYGLCGNQQIKKIVKNVNREYEVIE